MSGTNQKLRRPDRHNRDSHRDWAEFGSVWTFFGTGFLVLGVVWGVYGGDFGIGRGIDVVFYIKRAVYRLIIKEVLEKNWKIKD